MIKVKNIGSSTVYIVAPDFHFRRKLPVGREVQLTQEIYDELTFDSGFQNLIRCGCIRLTGINVENTEVIETPNTVLSREELIAIFDTKNYAAFSKAMADASPATKESAANIAVEKRIADAGFTTLIKKYCDVDVLEAIARVDADKE